MSIGKSINGNNQWCYFNEPTPNESNNTSLCYEGIVDKPYVNLESGWYKQQQNIDLNIEENTSIFYTTDGSIPNELDNLYEETITINSTTCMSFRAFSNTKIPSQVIDKTYIFEEDNNNLAVFSIHTNPENLWSEESGIYVPIFPNSQISSYPYFESNFWQPWSKFSRLEYFNSNKEKS